MSTALDMTEAQLEASTLDLADWCYWLSYHTYDSRRSARGFPDRVFLRRGRMLFVEFKSEAGKLTPAQERWLTELRLVASKSRGAVEVHVWRPADWFGGVIEEVLR